MTLRDETLGELLSLAGVALLHEDLPTALDEICRIAARAVPADGASLTSFESAGPQAAAASNEWAEALDEMQYVEHEGPCLDAARTGAVFRVRDMPNEMRWPSYMPRAAALGAASMVSVPMTVEGKTIGALNVYSRRVDGFGSDAVSVIEIIAAHASLAAQVSATLVGHRTLAAQLRVAMESRATIEQAKGIIMATARCDADTAFARLVDQSQHDNRKLRDVADELVRRQSRAS